MFHFFINCKAIARQINILTDESGEVEKGENGIISWLHYFFDVHGLGKTDVHLHVDNCKEQNKNNIMINFEG